MQAQSRVWQGRIHAVRGEHWDEGIIHARHDQGILPNRGQREKAGPDRPRHVATTCCSPIGLGGVIAVFGLRVGRMAYFSIT
jgi:hypothetical protein